MSRQISRTVLAASAVASLALGTAAVARPPGQVERGRYLVAITGCNDCHTEGYAPSGGQIPESQWLLGSRLGYRGDWGTTYAANLRLYMQAMSEDEWVKKARTMQTRPPMPWFGLHRFKDSDLRAMHAFVRSLGAPGEPAPAALGPGQEAKGPVVVFPGPPPGAR